MGRRVDVADLVDATAVATLLGLSHRNSVATYQKRYPDMPRPVVDNSGSRCRLWLRSEVAAWLNARRGDIGTGRDRLPQLRPRRKS
jgi:glutathione-regulated potassium-efflux system ancillary protein KefG